MKHVKSKWRARLFTVTLMFSVGLLPFFGLSYANILGLVINTTYTYGVNASTGGPPSAIRLNQVWVEAGQTISLFYFIIGLILLSLVTWRVLRGRFSNE